MRAKGGRESKQAKKKKANNEAPFEAWTYRVSLPEIDATSFVVDFLVVDFRGHVEQSSVLLNESGVVHIKEGFCELAREAHLTRRIVDKDVKVLCAT
jgi:hypothetical protein